MLLVTGLVDAQQTRDNPASVTETVQQQVDRLADLVNREQAAGIFTTADRVAPAAGRRIARTAGGDSTAPQQTTEEAVARLNADVENIRERQEVQESQIATHQQDKVESASKFPVKVTGLILMNTFVNTGAVDIPPSPTWPPVEVERPAFPCARRCSDWMPAGRISSGPARCGCAHGLFRRGQPSAVTRQIVDSHDCAPPMLNWPGMGRGLSLPWTVLSSAPIYRLPLPQLPSRNSRGRGICGTGCRKSAQSIL